jgi:hypothetical protein
MIALIPVIIEICMKLIGLFIKKAEDRVIAEKQLYKIFKAVDALNEKTAALRQRYNDSKERLRNHY